MSWTTPLTALPHLSDEAVAAFADGVLSGQARQRAQSHMAGCGECSDAVYGQRSASAMLRSASAPRAPSGLLDRLRELPITAELPTVQFPSGLSADGQPVFAAFASRDSAGQLGSVGVGSAAFGSAALGSVAFRTAPVAPVWSGPPATPPRLATSPDGAARQRSQAVPSHLSSPDHQASLDHPASTVHLRRRMSSRAGFGAAAVAAVAVGMLASTAAAAGGVTTTSRPAAPAVRSSSGFVVSPSFGQTETALLTYIPSPR